MKNTFTSLAAKSAALGTATMATTYAALAADDTGFFNDGIANDKLSAVGSTDTSLVDTITNLINTALGFLGIIAVVIIIYSGIQLIISRGDEKAVTNAKNTLLYSVIGFALIILSWQIVNFIVSTLAGAA